MAFSQHQITDINAVIANGPQGTTNANSLAAAGPINDYVGNTRLIQEKLNEVKQLLTLVISVTDNAGDATNLALLQGITNDLV